VILSRIRTTGSATLIVLVPVLAVVLPPGTADAGTPRCAGMRATIVSSKARVIGTPGADVIVALHGKRGKGGGWVEGRGGNDRICYRGHGRAFTIQGGAGDDVLRNESSTDMWFEPGSGADRVVSRGGDDSVLEYKGKDRDVIRLGGGDDYAESMAPPGRGDRIDLGAGNDELRLMTPVTRGPIPDGGRGSDQISLDVLPDDATGAWVVDNSGPDGTGAGTLDKRRRAAWRSFERFAMGGGSSTRFIGGDKDEFVSIRPPDAGDFDVSMGAGDDETLVRAEASVVDSLQGGPGDDVISVDPFIWTDDTVTGSLLTDEISYPWQDEPLTISFAGYEGISVSTLAAVDLTGDAGPNRLNAFSCDAVVHAGDGNDMVTADGYFDMDEGGECSPSSEFFGEAGDDGLSGSWGDDVLVGGDGTDLADGRKGVDHCEAESSVDCEN
jgi:hypothetical protein